MHRTSTLALVALLATTAGSRAEFFMLQPDDVPQQADTAVEPATAPHKAPLASPSHNTLKPVPDKKKRTTPIALGFGRSVPLSFAVRQIVPRSITVRYGASADTDAPVDWQGDREWRLVLQDALRPLGLKLSLRGATAVISK